MKVALLKSRKTSVYQIKLYTQPFVCLNLDFNVKRFITNLLKLFIFDQWLFAQDQSLKLLFFQQLNQQRRRKTNRLLWALYWVLRCKEFNIILFYCLLALLCFTSYGHSVSGSFKTLSLHVIIFHRVTLGMQRSLIAFFQNACHVFQAFV